MIGIISLPGLNRTVPKTREALAFIYENIDSVLFLAEHKRNTVSEFIENYSGDNEFRPTKTYSIPVVDFNILRLEHFETALKTNKGSTITRKKYRS